MSTAPAPDIETSSDAYARRFDGAAGHLFLQRQEAVITRALSDKRDASILDVGGGHAQLSGPLAMMGHQVTVTGSTPDCAARLGRDSRNEGVRFEVGPLDELPFADRTFDTVIAIRLMAHVEDWDGFVGELCRVADHSVVIDYPELVSANLLSLAAFGIKKRIEGDTRDYRNFRAGTLKKSFAKRGFRVSLVERQFLLPMALHRAGKAIAPLRLAEQAARAIGLTRRFGNPAIMRADRVGKNA